MWFPKVVSEHVSTCWLAVKKNRLLTKDVGEMLCTSFKNQIESCDHLYFECSFSGVVCLEILRKCLISHSKQKRSCSMYHI